MSDLNLDEIRARVKEMRSLGHRAVTEGVNLKYVEQMRQALYAAAEEQDALLDRLSTLQAERDAWKVSEGNEHFRADELEARVAELTKALERIALGIEGRRQSGFLPGESDGMPATDWMLAREALKKP